MNLSLNQKKELFAPQVQPWIEKKTEHYQSTLVKLNLKSVKSFAVLSQFNNPQHKLEIYPDSCPKLLISLDKTNNKSLLIGARDHLGTVELHPQSDVFLASLYSYYGTKNWKIKTAESFNQIIELSDALEQAEILEFQLLQANSFEERVNLIKNFYLLHMTDFDYDVGIAEYAALYLNKHFNDVKINKLVESIGYSRRHIENQFKLINGVSLKKYSSIYRFQKALKVMFDKEMSNADIAQKMGYFDESHLIKDFHSYTGLSPLKLVSMY
ncbi:helix-turn-helix domain-containing protein [Streptococcus zalophi]|uniref:Helix-turn-helix domain-containing protein n=1 Tax=Streptococcus zalophi TaxID=640031 RepID=A0A934PAT5_9STRE|nr:helix-turn-helix domain-containing protein [Streptococcus zalophi]MBJ8350023.1 helix-turn-helix domain-containing protein [Streptococcus zalophi]MCR8967029.1 helix-turn-helix domain-containing protein [Streptococcus zalophi]